MTDGGMDARTLDPEGDERIAPYIDKYRLYIIPQKNRSQPAQPRKFICTVHGTLVKEKYKFDFYSNNLFPSASAKPSAITFSIYVLLAIILVLGRGK